MLSGGDVNNNKLVLVRLSSIERRESSSYEMLMTGYFSCDGEVRIIIVSLMFLLHEYFLSF